jgi:REP element-mobilizing transposase RayT
MRPGVVAVAVGRARRWCQSRPELKQCRIKMARRLPKQLALPTPRTWGGRRIGAGRKPAQPRPNVAHAPRDEHDARHPVHVTLRAARGLRSLRSEPAFAALIKSLAAARRDGFRIVHYSVQTDHIHLIVEADDGDKMRSGLQGLAGRAALAVNRVWRRRGGVWGDRYHARPLTTPREVRNGLVYVLLNFRKHLRAPPGIDPRSSGSWFDGWSRTPTLPTEPCPVAAPRTWLGAIGWRRAGGAIDTRETPGAR